MSDDFYRKLDEAEIKGRNERIFRDRPENLHDYQGCEHMPWMQANRAYDDGYNAGIAAAAAAINRLTIGLSPADHRKYVAESCARTVLTLMRPVAPPSE